MCPSLGIKWTFWLGIPVDPRMSPIWFLWSAMVPPPLGAPVEPGWWVTPSHPTATGSLLAVSLFHLMFQMLLTPKGGAVTGASNRWECLAMMRALCGLMPSCIWWGDVIWPTAMPEGGPYWPAFLAWSWWGRYKGKQMLSVLLLSCVDTSLT